MNEKQSTSNVTTNRLYYGDCLTIMKEMDLGSADLIYLDPPFNSARDYNAIYKDETGRPLPDQIEAFSDTWQFDVESERACQAMPTLMREYGLDDEIAEFWHLWAKALRKTNPALLSYLVYMTERLLPMREILKPTGSIYLHCDPTASHYIKIMMDSIFGHKNFINEIVWHYQTGGSGKRWFAKKHDTILFYGKTSKYKFNPDSNLLQVRRGEGAIARAQNQTGARLDADDTTKTAMSVWTDIQALNPMAKERLGYSTQKPLDLLERIIAASTDEGDVVFDPFCGCATTIEAAHRLKRKWIGIDIAIHAIKRVANVRLQDRLGLIEGEDYKIEGIPHNLEGAQDLWKADKYHFQKWAVEQVGGFVTNRKSADGGIDGRLYFTLDDSDKDLSSMVLEVKGGENITIGMLRDLRGVLEREDDEDGTTKMAGLIIMKPLGSTQERNFKQEMASAGDLELKGEKYARMQLLTIQEILDGKQFHTPEVKAKGLAQRTFSFGSKSHTKD